MRPSREELLVATAFTWAQRSTCSRLHVGAVIHREGRILVQGYNGAPTGLAHCNHECTCTGDYPYYNEEFNETRHSMRCPALMPCTRSVHAEANAIAYAARWGVELEGSAIVITNQPCLNCSMLIINSGIRMVTYVLPYRLTDGVSLLGEAGIPVEQYLDWEEPSLIE
jgi:dCMP deaminase